MEIDLGENHTWGNVERFTVVATELDKMRMIRGKVFFVRLGSLFVNNWVV